MGNAIVDSTISSNDRDIIQAVMPYTMTPPERVLATIKSVEYVVLNNIAGVIVECGVWRGGNMLAALLKLIELNQERPVYLFDTFDGMTEPGDFDTDPQGTSAAELLTIQPKDKNNHIWAYCPLEDVKALFSKVQYPQDLIHFVPGRVEDTIPYSGLEEIAVLRLDTDWYESTLHELTYLYPQVTPGGVIMLDDYGHWNGARRATDEFLKSNVPHVQLEKIDDIARRFIKPRQEAVEKQAKNTSQHEGLASLIEEDDYIRQRINPHYSDPLYLHLQDLLHSIKHAELSAVEKVFDYGCGGSPYKELFNATEYHRADYINTTGLDYVIRQDSTVAAPSNYYDCVLSTQVLEHVAQPEVYLRECYRMLKNKAALLLTTHGIYEEHGCPYDFVRWTSDGLQALCKKQGFSIKSCYKTTTGVRALLFLLKLYNTRFPAFPDDALGSVLHNLRVIMETQPQYFHQWCDTYLNNHCASNDAGPEHGLYIGLTLVCYKE